MVKQYLSPRRWMLVLLVFLTVSTLALAACTSGTFVVGIEPPPTSTPYPTPVIVRYVDHEYGFIFHYPETWTLAEEPHMVRLSRGTLTLRIAYGWASDPGFGPGRTGVPAGDFIYGDKVFFLDQVIPAQVLEYERKDKMVFYGGPGLVEVGDLVFSIWLEDVNGADYSELDIPKELQAEAKEILESFEFIEATGKPPAPIPTPIERDTLTYENTAYQFSFQYPATWAVEEVVGETMDDGTKLADAVVLTQGKFKIIIQHQRKSDPAPTAWGGSLVPGGMGYGEAILADPVTLLGEDTRKLIWTYNGGIKAVEVNTHGEYADLVLSITLADSSVVLIQDPGAETVPEFAIAALDRVVGSFTATQ